MLTRVHNGLGKTTDLEYSTSTELMLAAEAAGIPWTSKMPVVAPVVVRSTVSDDLDLIGREPGRYVTEYSYRDPVYEPRQREFRGFRVAEVRSLGDANSPTAVERSEFLLGECASTRGATDSCSPSERWRDNPREALKGALALAETREESGIYHSTRHSSYELRQLCTGRDGRRVVAAFPVAQDTFLYDVSAFDGTATTVSMTQVSVNFNGSPTPEVADVPKRAQTGAVRVHSELVYDNYGNPTQVASHGCVEGCTSGVDEIITQTTVPGHALSDASGWLWRPASSHVTGSVRTALRRSRELTRCC